MKASDSFCPWNSISDLFSSCHGVIWDYEHSLTLLQCTVHGNVVIHWTCYIVLSMVMSSLLPWTVQCSRVNEWRHNDGQYNVAGSKNDDIITFVDPATLYWSWLCRHTLTLLLLYCPWLRHHSLTLLHCTVHGYFVIHWPSPIHNYYYYKLFLYLNLCLSVVLGGSSCHLHPYPFSLILLQTWMTTWAK
jgi:hypothetical protein